MGVDTFAAMRYKPHDIVERLGNMKFIPLLFLFLLSIGGVYGQCNVKVIKAKIQTAHLQRRTNPEVSKKAAKSALACAERLNEDSYISTSLNILGYHNLLEGDTKKAYKQFRRSLDISEKAKNDTSVAIAQNYLGNYYNFLGLDELALVHYLKSLKLKRKLNYTNGIDVGLVNVGIIYDKQGKHKKALEFYEEALVIKRQKKDKYGIALVYENMGIVKAEMNDHTSAMEYFEKAQSIYESIDFQQGILGVNISKAILLVNSGYIDESEELLNEIQRDVLDGKDIVKIQMWYKTYFDVAFEKEDYPHAIAYADSSLSYAESIEDLSIIIEMHQALARAHESNGDAFLSLTYANKALILKDSLSTINSTVAIEELQLRYETDVLNNKIDVQEKNIALLNLENRSRLYFIVLISIAAIGLILGIYRKYRSNLKQKESLKQELDQSNKELLSFTVQTAKKNEAIQKLKESLHSNTDGTSISNEREIQHLFREVERTEDNWQEFKMRFEKIDPDFFHKLSSQYQLSETDLRICALIKLNVTTQEAANMLNITSDSVNKARYRLRKKLDLPKEVELNSFVRGVS